jgi:hypothetical protein
MDLTFRNVDQVCAQATLSDTPTLELSSITFFRPFAIVYLGMFLRHHSYCGRSCRVVLPNNIIAKGYLARQNFWERFSFSHETIEREKLNRITTSTSLNDIVDIENTNTIAEEVERQVKNVLIVNHVKTSIPELANIACELVDNFAQHSRETLAVFHMQYYPNINEVALAVADCGIGIRNSLSSNSQYASLADEPHHVAALKAFEPGVTCSEGGMGLTEIKDSITSLNGRLLLSTGDEYVKIDQRYVTYGKMAYDLTGVQVEVSFPVGG